jgi:hypothetical protein
MGVYLCVLLLQKCMYLFHIIAQSRISPLLLIVLANYFMNVQIFPLITFSLFLTMESIISTNASDLLTLYDLTGSHSGHCEEYYGLQCHVVW